MAEPLYCYPLEVLCQPLSWWSSAASWAQALLSAAAIYFAARVARWQRTSELKEKAKADALIARSFGLAVLREAQALRTRLEDGLEQVLVPFPETETRQIRLVLMPQGLWESTPQLHLIGEAASPLLSAIYQLQEAREHVTVFEKNHAYLWGDERDFYAEHLEKAINDCSEALKRLRAMLE